MYSCTCKQRENEMKIEQEKCIGCGSCQMMCPAMAIEKTPDNKCKIDETKCMNCGTCAAACPMGAITH